MSGDPIQHRGRVHRQPVPVPVGRRHPPGAPATHEVLPRASRRSAPSAVAAPATPPTVEAAHRLGLDLDLAGHESRRLDASVLDAADLVLAMERRHVQEVVVLAPGAFGRTFTLKEIVRRGSEIGRRRADEPLASWLARVHLGRKAMQLLGSSTADDVADPTVSTMVDHDAMAREVLDLVDRLVELAWP